MQPIIGCQVSLPCAAERLAPDPLVLLAQDAAGLDNLQRLSSRGFIEGDPADPAAAARPCCWSTRRGWCC